MIVSARSGLAKSAHPGAPGRRSPLGSLSRARVNLEHNSSTSLPTAPVVFHTFLEALATLNAPPFTQTHIPNHSPRRKLHPTRAHALCPPRAHGPTTRGPTMLVQSTYPAGMSTRLARRRGAAGKRTLATHPSRPPGGIGGCLTPPHPGARSLPTASARAHTTWPNRTSVVHLHMVPVLGPSD